MNTFTVLVAGASGVVGQGAITAFASAGARVIALSRRAPDTLPGNVEHIALDLTDAVAVADAASRFADVTHLVYAALYEKPGLLPGWLEADQMQTNLAMLQNLLQPLLKQASGLRHVTLLQGTKAYGAHVHAIAVPARESSPRDAHENFYWLQEDYLKRAIKTASDRGHRLHYTIVRPQVVFGHAAGSAMNVIPILGVYGALLKASGMPLHFPGRSADDTPDTISEAVDADLLGRMFCWAAQSTAARDQVYNVTNGDVFVWRNVWPTIAQALGMAVGENRPLVLADWLPAQASRWQQIVDALQLQAPPMHDILGESHYYADALMGVHAPTAAPSALVSTIKLRQAGFSECMDTEQMFARLFAELQARRMLPVATWDGRH